MFCFAPSYTFQSLDPAPSPIKQSDKIVCCALPLYTTSGRVTPKEADRRYTMSEEELGPKPVLFGFGLPRWLEMKAGMRPGEASAWSAAAGRSMGSSR